MPEPQQACEACLVFRFTPRRVRNFTALPMALAVFVIARWLPFALYMVFTAVAFDVDPRDQTGVFWVLPLLLHLAAVAVAAYVAGWRARALWAPIALVALVTLSTLLDWDSLPGWYTVAFALAATPLAFVVGQRSLARL